MKNTNKTKPTKASVKDYIAQLDNEKQKSDSLTLIEMMENITKHDPVMWGDSIIGFGSYHYQYATGREGEWLKIGFAPRNGKSSLYVTCDANQFKTQLKNLGPHKTGVDCIYIRSLDSIDQSVLQQLITKAYNEPSAGEQK